MVKLHAAKSLSMALTKLLRRRQGAGLVEFALIAPIFFTAIIGIMEVSMILFVSAMLEAGLRDALAARI